MGERSTSPLPLSAWGSDPACRQIHDKIRWHRQNIRFTRTQRGVPNSPRGLTSSAQNAHPSTEHASEMQTIRQKMHPEAVWGNNTRSLRQNLEAGRRRDEPGKEKVDLKNCFVWVVTYFARASLRARRALGRLAGARSTEAPSAPPIGGGC